MRILWLLPDFNYTSAARQASLVVPELARAGHTCRVAALRGGGPFTKHLQAANIETVELSSPHDLPLRAIWNLRQLLSSWSPDVIHVWRRPAARALELMRWLRRRGERVVISQVDRNQHIPMAVGRSTAKCVRDSQLIMCLGPLDKAHSFFDAIWAFDVLHMVLKDLRLEIIGDGPELARLVSFGRNSNRDNRAITFHSASIDAIHRLGEAAMVWIPCRLPVGEQVALEAQAAGTPVLASKLPNLAAVIDDRVTGMLLPPGEPVAWAKAARQLFENPGELYRLGEAGPALAARHSPADIASRWLEAY